MSLHHASPDYLEQCRQALAQEQARSLAETENWSHVDKPQVHADWGVLYQELARLIGQVQPADAAFQALVARHYAILCRFYTPSKEAYIGLGLFYAENPEMKAYHNSFHPQMVAVLGDAIYVYAQQNLA